MSELQKHSIPCATEMHVFHRQCDDEGKCRSVYVAYEVDAHIADLKRQHVEELAKMAGDQLARDADMYNLAEEVKRLREKLRRFPADWEDDSSLETWFPFTADELAKLRVAHSRYEKLRRLNPRQFLELWQTNLKGFDRFDELVDALP